MPGALDGEVRDYPGEVAAERHPDEEAALRGGRQRRGGVQCEQPAQ